MMSQETFCLKWKSYDIHLTTAWEDTEEEEIMNNIEGAAENEDQDITNETFVVETRSLSSTLDELIAFDVNTPQSNAYFSGDVKNGE